MEGQSQEKQKDDKILHVAKEWRRLDKDASADKASRDKQRAEYRKRQQLRDVIDQAGQP
jgi:hypothetical protein